MDESQIRAKFLRQIVEQMQCPHDHIEDEEPFDDQAPARIREAAYRRGFQQALQYAIEMLEKGASLEQIKTYMGEVFDWRYGYKKYQGKRQYLSENGRRNEAPVPKILLAKREEKK